MKNFSFNTENESWGICIIIIIYDSGKLYWAVYGGLDVAPNTNTDAYTHKQNFETCLMCQTKMIKTIKKHIYLQANYSFIYFILMHVCQMSMLNFSKYGEQQVYER